MTWKSSLPLKVGDVVGLDIGELDLAGPQRRDRRGRVGEIAIDERVELRLAAAIVVVGGEFDILVGDVAGELEGAGADRRGRPPGAASPAASGGIGESACSRQHHHLGHRSAGRPRSAR